MIAAQTRVMSINRTPQVGGVLDHQKIVHETLVLFDLAREADRWVSPYALIVRAQYLDDLSGSAIRNRIGGMGNRPIHQGAHGVEMREQPCFQW